MQCSRGGRLGAQRASICVQPHGGQDCARRPHYFGSLHHELRPARAGAAGGWHACSKQQRLKGTHVMMNTRFGIVAAKTDGCITRSVDSSSSSPPTRSTIVRDSKDVDSSAPMRPCRRGRRPQPGCASQRGGGCAPAACTGSSTCPSLQERPVARTQNHESLLAPMLARGPTTRNHAVAAI